MWDVTSWHRRPPSHLPISSSSLSLFRHPQGLRVQTPTSFSTPISRRPCVLSSLMPCPPLSPHLSTTFPHLASHSSSLFPWRRQPHCATSYPSHINGNHIGLDLNSMMIWLAILVGIPSFHLAFSFYASKSTHPINTTNNCLPNPCIWHRLACSLQTLAIVKSWVKVRLREQWDEEWVLILMRESARGFRLVKFFEAKCKIFWRESNWVKGEIYMASV